MRALRLRFQGFISFVFICIVLGSNSAWAVGFQPVSPEELKMTSEPKVPGAPAIILYRQVDRDDRGKSSSTRTGFSALNCLPRMLSFL
jgi:hypothetical protein